MTVIAATAGVTAAQSNTRAPMPKSRSFKRTPRQKSRVQPTKKMSMSMQTDELLTIERHGKSHIKKWWIIDPRQSRIMPYWDAVTGVALVFTALVTPFEIGMLPPAESANDPLFIINRCIDCIFITDIAICFVLMYPQKGGDSHEGVTWIKEPRQIAAHYLRTWFLLDFFSVGVSGFDIMAVGGDSTFTASRMLRVLRAARLVKMLRLVRSSRIFKRWETRLALNYSYIALVRALLTALLFGHWVACSWVLQAKLVPGGPMTSWLGAKAFCTCVADEGEALSFGELSREELETCDFECMPPWQIYPASLYWALATITSIGYGDVSATLDNPAEITASMVLMMSAAIVWSNVIGTFCGVMSTMNPHLIAFRQRMDALNSFMHAENLPADLRQRAREYFHEQYEVGRGMPRELVNDMSPALRSEVVLRCNEKWLRPVWFLSNACEDFLVALALALRPLLFCPAEAIPPGLLYIVHRGIALCGGKMKAFGKAWGEDVILANPRLRHTYAARAMHYVELYSCTREDLLGISYRYPKENYRIRKFAIYMALRREIVRLAKEKTRAEVEAELAEKRRVKELQECPGPEGGNANGDVVAQAGDAEHVEVSEVMHTFADGDGDGGGGASMEKQTLIELAEQMRSMLAKLDEVLDSEGSDMGLTVM